LTASQSDTIKLLNKIPLPTIEALSNLSKSYISQVKSGHKPPSAKLIEALDLYLQSKRPKVDHIEMFLQSRKAMGCSLKTIAFYNSILSTFRSQFDCTKVTRQGIERFLNHITASNGNLCTRHAYYRTLKAFYNWSSKEYGINNPMLSIQAPILSKVILPSLVVEQVKQLIDYAENARDKAIISTFVESGLRLSELASIRQEDINFERHIIRVMGKGRKEAYAPFGDMAESYIRQWLVEHNSNGNIWGIT
jgi:site-specific recombinase XerD